MSPLRPPADCVYVAQVTIYARALDVALAQPTYDNNESSGRDALKKQLNTLELEGVLIEGDELHTTSQFLNKAWTREPA
jgi:hypothetical protein